MNKRPIKNILPENPTQAARVLIKLSQSLLSLAERETQALVQNDFVTFGILQDEKELLTTRYTNASEEFRGRLEDFRVVDKIIINQMARIQTELAEKTHANNSIVAKIKHRAEQKTQSTLFTAQEIAQQRPMRFANSQEERI